MKQSAWPAASHCRPLSCGPPILSVTSSPSFLYSPVTNAWSKAPCSACEYPLVMSLNFSCACAALASAACGTQQQGVYGVGRHGRVLRST